jgi:hypothetical protein
MESKENGTQKTQQENLDERYNKYLEVWQTLFETKRKAHEQLDSYLLKFSAGALAISLSPATGLFENPTEAPKCLLIIAWLLFLVTIGSTLWSFRTSAQSCDEMVGVMYEAMVEEKDSSRDQHRNIIGSTKTLNTIAILSFIAALLLSLLYLAITFAV